MLLQSQVRVEGNCHLTVVGWTQGPERMEIVVHSKASQHT